MFAFTLNNAKNMEGFNHIEWGEFFFKLYGDYGNDPPLTIIQKL